MGKTPLRLMAETRNFITEECHRRRSLSTRVWIHDLSQQVCHIHHSDSVLHYGERLQVDHKKVQVTQMWKIKTGTRCLDIFFGCLTRWVDFIPGCRTTRHMNKTRIKKIFHKLYQFTSNKPPGRDTASQNQQLQSEDVKFICSCL